MIYSGRYKDLLYSPISMSVEFYIQGVYKIGNDKDFIEQESIILKSYKRFNF